MRSVRAIALVALAPLWAGCAGFEVSRGRGVRVYDPAVYIVVSRHGDEFRSQTFVGPNLCSHYEIRPLSFLARNRFSLELQDGMAVRVDDDLDSGALLGLFQSVTEKAIAAGASAVGGSEPMEGRIRPGEGLWIWTGAHFAAVDETLACGALAGPP